MNHPVRAAARPLRLTAGLGLPESRAHRDRPYSIYAAITPATLAAILAGGTTPSAGATAEISTASPQTADTRLPISDPAPTPISR